MPNNIVNITLPSPAELWPKDYNFEKYSFYVNNKNKDNYQEAYAMVFADKEPKRYCLIFLLGVELQVIDNTAKA